MEPDLDVRVPQRCACPRHRRTIHRCSRCGRPVCFHCQTPHIAGRCAACAGLEAPQLRWRARAGHGLLAVLAGIAAIAVLLPATLAALSVPLRPLLSLVGAP